MENNNQKENGEYQFIREKVVSKRKSRLRRMFFSFGFTVFLAIVFGVVARLIFLYSDGPVRKFLGFEEEPPEATPTPVLTPTSRPVPTPTTAATLQPTAPAKLPVTEIPTPTVPEGEEKAPQEPEEEDGGPEQQGYAFIFAELRNVADKVKKSLVTVTVSVTGIDWLNDTYETESQTTGIVIEKNAEHLLVLVNLDRIQSASYIGLTIDKEYFEAELWNYDKDYNLAVIAVDSSRIPERFFNLVQEAGWGESASMETGMPVLALGNPNGYMGSMEFGMITSCGSTYYITDNSVDLFNTNTTDSENGDGVIANLDGEIIGIITRTLKSDLNEAMCTAMGSSNLKSIIAQLAAGEKRIYFGVRGEDIPASVLKEEGLVSGIYVMEVAADSPAFEAGIKTGDIILKVDETDISSYSEFSTLLDQHTDGDAVRVTIRRMVRMDPKIIEVKVVLSGK